MANYKACVFDMDGLMFDTESVSSYVWLEVAKRLNFPLTMKQTELFKGTNKEFKRELFEKWYKDTVCYEKAYQMKQVLMDEYISSHGVIKKKGLDELLEALKANGYKIALATATNRLKAISYLQSTNVLKYFDAIVAGDEVEKCKPNPDIFLKAINKLGVNPNEAIILEDSLNGLMAAYRAHATVIMIPDMIAPTEEIKKITNYIFNSLDEVIQII